MSTLHQLGLKYGTDKAADDHTFAGVSYLDVYEHYLKPIRYSDLVFVEIGVWKGASLRCWQEYLPNAQIWGLDNDPACKEVAKAEDRFQVILGSATDPAALAKIAPGQALDVVIDDASHLVDLMLPAFELFWPRVRSGGLYVLEDLWVTYGGNWQGHWFTQHNPPSTNFENVRARFDAWLLGRLRVMDRREGQLRYMHWWPGMCVLQKV